MEIGCNAGSNPFNLQVSPYPVTVGSIQSESGCKHDRGDEPPPPPEWRENPEPNRCRRLAEYAIRIYRPHQEPIRAGGEIRVGYRALVGGRAPLGISTFEFVLISERFASREIQPGKIDLNVVLGGAQFRPGDAQRAQF